MRRAEKIVKPFLTLLLLAAAVLPAVAGAAEQAGAEAAQPHMMYFYNPSCRLCTSTNEVVAKVEEKYGDSMTFQRFDIADAETGTDDVLYMFDLMDELQLPETDNTTLIVFLGVLETVDGEVYFTPERALVDGENIIEKLDAEIADFLAGDIASVSNGASAAEGGSPGFVRPASPFFPAA